MSKSINSNAMDSLLQGLTGKTEEQEAVPTQECPSEAPSPTRRKEKPRYEVISTMVDPDVMSKVRTIADIEGVVIKEIIGVGLDMFIRKYEELHGKVRVKKPRKGDISQIFNS